MESELAGSLSHLLEQLAAGPVATSVAVLAVLLVLAAIRGSFALSVARHGRRREFLETYHALCDKESDALALETVVRHGFGVWIPAQVIRRIRELPSPSQCLLMLGDVRRFFDHDPAAGTLTVEPRLATRPRARVNAMPRLIAYVVLSYASAILLGITDGLPNSPIVIVRIALGSSLAFLAYLFLDTGIAMWRVPEFVECYPTLVSIGPEAASNGKAIQGWAAVHNSLRLAKAWIDRTRIAIERRRYRDARALISDTDSRDSRPSSEDNTPRA